MAQRPHSLFLPRLCGWMRRAICQEPLTCDTVPILERVTTVHMLLHQASLPVSAASRTGSAHSELSRRTTRVAHDLTVSDTPRRRSSSANASDLFWVDDDGQMRSLGCALSLFGTTKTMAGSEPERGRGLEQDDGLAPFGIGAIQRFEPMI